MNAFQRARPGWLRRWSAGVALALSLAAGWATASAYVLQGQQWPADQQIVMDLELGASGTLFDGSTSWNQVAEAALGVWNPYLGSGVQFQFTSTGATPVQGDGKNSVFFSTAIYGEAFGDDTLGITISYYNPATNIKTEADVIFNSAEPFNSYRGPLRYDSSGNYLFDLRRVAIHEFGHVLGLNHVAQSAASIMTPFTTDYDTVQADDIAGVQAMYGALSAPAITSGLTAGGAAGQPFSYQIAATNAPTGYGASGLPAGLVLDTSTGLISGTVATVGTYGVVISAFNGGGTGTANLTLTFANPPVVGGSLAVSTTFGQSFTYQITASNQPSSFSVSTLPAGLSFNAATGLISGAPTVIGTFPITLGATNSAGTGSASLVLKVTLLDNALTTLHSFAGSDGSAPAAALIQAADGNFYGTTNLGGTNNRGTAFKMTPDGVLTTLCSFPAGNPISALVQGGDGNFYGTTKYGGDNGVGSVFRLTPDGTLTTLHSFTEAEGTSPSALVPGGDGNFYGTASSAGSGDGGAVFKVSPDGTLTVLHGFDRSVAAYPTGALAPGTDGNFYGTTGSGLNAGFGTVYQITPGGVLTVLHTFTGGADGGGPSAGLVQGNDGEFYGTTGSGGTNDDGTFYKITPTGALVTLYDFSSTDGTSRSTLFQATDGKFYGTSYFGGPSATADPMSGGGVIYQLSATGTLKLLHSFDGTDGLNPYAALVQGSDGNLYGTTSGASLGGAATGTVFKRSIGSSAPTVTLTATTPEITLGSGEIGVFTVALSAVQDTDVFVNYTIKGSATNGTDYVQLSGTKKIKAGKLSRPIEITPLGTLGGADKKVVKLTLAPGDGYTVGTTTFVKVKILSGQ